MFSSNTGAFGAQTTLHHSTNFANPVHQHQPLMVPHPHHHPPPPLPYFAPFHLSHHPHSEFPSASELQTSNLPCNTAPSNTFLDHQDVSEQPKVIVPNIEEELGYLTKTCSTNVKESKLNNLTSDKIKISDKPLISSNANTGFMASYLKFLQGERDTSPPPQNRAGRKATWARPPKIYIPPEPRTNISTNGTTSITSSTARPKSEKTPPPLTYDPEDDPRYFPLPKTSVARSLHSLSESESDSEFGIPLNKPPDKSNTSSNSIKNENKNVKTITSNKSEDKNEKSKTKEMKEKNITPVKKRPGPKPGPKTEAKKNTKERKEKPVKPSIQLPRRETSKRKAKDQTNLKLLDKSQEEEYEDEDMEDSDTDPAWVPGATKDLSDEEGPGRKRSKGRNKLSPYSRRKKLQISEEESSDSDKPSSEKKLKKTGQNSRGQKRRKNDLSKRLKSVMNSPAISPHNKTTEDISASLGFGDSGCFPFTAGSFVVIKSELNLEYPSIWRVDGKTLLQKYEPFVKDGETLYRNISTYSGWSAQNKHTYQQVPVKVRLQDKLESVVEFVRSELQNSIDDQEILEKSMQDTEKFQDNFEVYIQTLISQALDSNFLSEILQEKDEYFLINVRTIDELTENHRLRLLNANKWRNINLIKSIDTWPCFNILSDLPESETKNKECAACDLNKDACMKRIIMYGQPYNNTTLEGSSPDPKIYNQKDFLVCYECVRMINLYSKIAHQKYLMYIQCAKLVADKRSTDPNKDTTVVLNELLANENWLNQLFIEVRTLWAQVLKVEKQALRKKNS
uniref:DUF4211 domain-containing protein n=1 Tax=Clastoptera arizonana TaxID=38151 RepID=A0A1B6EGU2_9HEMI